MTIYHYIWAAVSTIAVLMGLGVHSSNSDAYPHMMNFTRKIVGQITLDGASRRWIDGTYATSCSGYLNPTLPKTYSGSTGDGVYTIDPDGSGGNAAFNVYCDMTGGAWMLIMKTQTQNYTDAMWTSTQDINQLDCISVATTNDNNCKIGGLYTLSNWTTLKLVNKTDSGWSGIVPKNASRTSLYNHLTGAALADSNLNALMWSVMANSSGSAPAFMKWNEGTYSFSQRTYTVRISHDASGAGTGGLGSTKTSGSCGSSFPVIPDGNWRCNSGSAKKIWWWLK